VSPANIPKSKLKNFSLKEFIIIFYNKNSLLSKIIKKLAFSNQFDKGSKTGI
jgi:hypothetical protein